MTLQLYCFVDHGTTQETKQTTADYNDNNNDEK